MEETSETQTVSYPLLLEEVEEEAKEMVVLVEAETQVSVFVCLKYEKIYVSS